MLPFYCYRYTNTLLYIGVLDKKQIISLHKLLHKIVYRISSQIFSQFPIDYFFLIWSKRLTHHERCSNVKKIGNKRVKMAIFELWSGVRILWWRFKHKKMMYDGDLLKTKLRPSNCMCVIKINKHKKSKPLLFLFVRGIFTNWIYYYIA